MTRTERLQIIQASLKDLEKRLQLKKIKNLENSQASQLSQAKRLPPAPNPSKQTT